ncbi:MAG: dihydrofolate reductase [Candidatus Uhrbacteria bacterium]
MKTTLFMAASLNGMIATKNGDENFLSDANWQSFSELVKESGCFIVGRKTYEAVQKWTEFNFDKLEAKLKIVVSSDQNLKLSSSFLLAGSPKEALEKAVAMNFENIILAGGSTLNSAFMKENLIDEVILNFEPTIIGNGVPLFAESDFEKRLTLVETVKISDGILQVRYLVERL